MLLFAFLALILNQVTTSQAASQNKPNFLFILVDDLGHNDIGYNGKRYGSAVKTPHLDSLAQNGVKLDNYYVHSVCTPTRGALLTGKYDIHTGLQHEVIKPSRPHGLPLEFKLLPEWLEECGYTSHMIGKWHLGVSKTAFLPWKRGFKSFSGMLIGEENHYTRYQCHRRTLCGYDWWTEHGPSNDTYGEYSTHLYTKKAIEAIEKHKASNEPFFLYLAFQAPHRPIQAPVRYHKPYRKTIKNLKRRKYAAMVSALDEAVQNITQYLSRNGLLNDTIIVFSSDNGGEPREGGNNFPLRGRKGTLWEGGVKTVGFVHGERLNRSGTYKGLMHVTDWLPTFLDVAGCPLSANENLDGISQWQSIITNDTSPRTEVLHTIDHKFRKTSANENFTIFDSSIRASIRVGNWKLITGEAGIADHTPPPELATIRTMNAATPNAGVKLFNLLYDPYESNELSNSHPKEVDMLLRRLAFYSATVKPSVYKKGSKKADPKLRGGFWGPWLD